MGMLRQKNAFRVAVGLHGEGCDWPMVGSLEVARGPISDDTQTKGPGGVVTAAEALLGIRRGSPSFRRATLLPATRP